MGWRKWDCMVVIMLIIIFGNSECYGCVEKERIALLHLEASMFYPNMSASTLYWADEKLSECCQWERVDCSTTSGHIVTLFLNETCDSYYSGDWYLNVSMFLPFDHLKNLFLNRNGIVGCIHNEGFERASQSLTNLETLDLSDNLFTDINIVSSLINLQSLNLAGNNLAGSVNVNGNHMSQLNSSSLEVIDLTDNDLNESNILSYFLQLPSLKYLYLRSNDMNRSISITGFKRFSRLSNLELLDLSHNSGLSNTILSHLGAVSSVKILDLTDTGLKGAIHIQELFKSTNIKELVLSNNEIESFHSIQGIGNFNQSNNLENLYLNDNLCNNKILSSLSAFPSLKSLYMQGNQLKGSIHIEDFGVLRNLERLVVSNNEVKEFVAPAGWHKLKKLKMLVLHDNKFEGTLSPFLGNMTSLQVLDISNNRFSGNIGSFPLTNLRNLKYLALSNNSFQIPISFRSFENHSNLEVLLCDANRLILDPSPQTWRPKFQLKMFTLAYSELVDFTAVLPKFLYYQSDLRILELSHCNFEGVFPTWLFENNTNLEILQVRNNHFTGPFTFPLHPNTKLSILDVSENNIHSQIPANISLSFPSLYFLNMSSNALNGEIPPSFGDLNSLIFLDLSRNNLSGGLPKELVTHSFSLYYLKLSHNILSGEIFPTTFNLTRLHYLYLKSNKFVGKIPDLSLSRALQVFDFSNNFFSGELPIWIGNSTSLEGIALAKNNIEGPIPKEFCKLGSLYFLDLSENKISGSIPSCVIPYIRQVHLNDNKLSGKLSPDFFSSSSLVSLDLSNNFFTGSIPTWFHSFSELTVLLLKNNSFDGYIPAKICELQCLRLLDFSRNNISGHIPLCLSNITFNVGEERNEMEYMHFGSISSLDFLDWLSVDIPYQYASLKNIDILEAVEFRTKSNYYSYKGIILKLFSGIDLSSNQLTGEIPQQLGYLSKIQALNLSHNNLNGSIPTTFSNLRQIESLDLSYNNLIGSIPSQLTGLTFLEVFNVEHNNLSGRIPELKAQFGTFGKEIYQGNPLICGPPLENSCSKTEKLLPASDESDGDGVMDRDMFRLSFVGSYITMLLAIMGVLYINPHWRQAWFYLVEHSFAKVSVEFLCLSTYLITVLESCIRATKLDIFHALLA